MFEGFPRQSVEYLKELKFNNNRDWFEEHREEYNSLFVQPALQLIEALSLILPHQVGPSLGDGKRRTSNGKEALQA